MPTTSAAKPITISTRPRATTFAPGSGREGSIPLEEATPAARSSSMVVGDLTWALPRTLLSRWASERHGTPYPHVAELDVDGVLAQEPRHLWRELHPVAEVVVLLGLFC